MYSSVPEHEKSCHRKEVAIALSADANAAWRATSSDFDPISECLMQIRLKMHSTSGHVLIIAVYAPKNATSKEDESEQFYLDLQELVCKVPKRDMLLIMGTVSNDVEAWHESFGRFSLDDRNDNGE